MAVAAVLEWFEMRRLEAFDRPCTHQVHDHREDGDGDRLELEARVELGPLVIEVLDVEALAELLVDLLGELLDLLRHEERDHNGKRHANREGLP